MSKNASEQPVIFNVSSRKDAFLEDSYKKAMKELDDFFRLNWTRNRPRLFIVKDRETIDKLRRAKTENWLVGWANWNKDVYLLDKADCAKESDHTYSDEGYFRLIKHELAHLFFQIVSGFKSEHNIEPFWLSEGVSVYLSGQTYTKEIRLGSFIEDYKKNSASAYREGGLAVKYLVEKHGKTKLLTLIRSLKTIHSENEFKKTFKRIYGFELNYRNFANAGKPPAKA